jgi:hypothetical protein
MRVVFPIFIALALAISSTAGAESGMTEKFIVAGIPEDLARLDRSNSAHVAASVDAEVAASDTNAPEAAARDEAHDARSRMRALLGFMLLAISAPHGNAP